MNKYVMKNRNKMDQYNIENRKVLAPLMTVYDGILKQLQDIKIELISIQVLIEELEDSLNFKEKPPSKE
jgi:hypothetical protein